MKKIILFILVFSSTLSFAQITLYHNVYVNSEDQSKFEMVERDYMSKLAQKAVNDGKFIYWALEKVLQPSNTMGGEVNHQLVGNWYQFVIVYSDMKAYLNVGPWWSDTDNLLGVTQELLSYKVKQGGMYLWHIKDSAMVTGAKFSAYNFGFS